MRKVSNIDVVRVGGKACIIIATSSPTMKWKLLLKPNTELPPSSDTKPISAELATLPF